MVDFCSECVKKPQRRRSRSDLGCRAIGWVGGAVPSRQLHCAVAFMQTLCVIFRWRARTQEWRAQNKQFHSWGARYYFWNKKWWWWKSACHVFSSVYGAIMQDGKFSHSLPCIYPAHSGINRTKTRRMLGRGDVWFVACVSSWRVSHGSRCRARGRRGVGGWLSQARPRIINQRPTTTSSTDNTHTIDISIPPWHNMMSSAESPSKERHQGWYRPSCCMAVTYIQI
jgi:hypothetical protein